MESVVTAAEKSRIDGGLVYTWRLRAGQWGQPVWAGATPLRMVLATGSFGGARVGVGATVTPDDGEPFLPVSTAEGLAFRATQPRGVVLSPFGLWLRPEVAGGDATTEVVVTLALVNPGHQRPMD